MTVFEPIGSGFFGVTASQSIVFGLFQSPILSNVPFWPVLGVFGGRFLGGFKWLILAYILP